MENFKNYDNFLPNIRKSLYGKARSEEPHQEISKKSKKVKVNFDLNGSILETFTNRRQSTPFKKDFKTPSNVHNGDDTCNQQFEKLTDNVKKRNRKKAVVSSINFSGSFDEEFKQPELTPSKSELERNFWNVDTLSESSFEITNSGISEQMDDVEEFDLESFFNKHELSDINESSVAECHSGISNEFVSDYVKDVKIMSSDSIIESNTWGKEITENTCTEINNSEENYSKENLSSKGSKKNITSEIEKMEESVIIDDDYSEGLLATSEENTNYTQEKTSGEHRTAEYHNLGDKELIILKENQTISFYGFFNLKVLHGKIEILGGVLDGHSNSVKVYSPRGSALLCISNITQTQQNYLLPVAGQEILLPKNCAAFLCSKLEDIRISFLEKYMPQKIFPKHNYDISARVIFEPTENLNILKNNTVWDEILENINCDSKLMIAGGKGVGKSTLLRYSINRLLNKFDKVRVLDLDPGQSEFTVPGCISVVTITEPVFGPNFTHLKQADRSLLSNINVAHDPQAYIKSVKNLVIYLESTNEECPILINYMGFAQGIGINIISSAIKYVRPTNIIQIESKNQNKNFKSDLSLKVVEENCDFFIGNDFPQCNNSRLNYKLHKVPAMNDENDGWTLEPRVSREMNILSYFSQMIKNNVYSLTSHDLPMYEIGISDIKITNLYGEAISPAVINANMVALCSLDEKSNIFVCRGYGIVRGIDLDLDKLVLTTPEPADVLEDVFYLVLGSVSLPPSVYMMPGNVEGTIPYVMEGELVSLGQITKRSYIPVHKK